MSEIASLQKETLLYLEALGDHSQLVLMLWVCVEAAHPGRKLGVQLSSFLRDKGEREQEVGLQQLFLSAPSSMTEDPQLGPTASSFCDFPMGPHWGPTQEPLGKFKKQTSASATILIWSKPFGKCVLPG